MCDCEVSLSGTDDKPRDWIERAGDPSDHKFIVSEMETIYKLIPLLRCCWQLNLYSMGSNVFLISSRGINDSHIDRSGIQISLPPSVIAPCLALAGSIHYDSNQSLIGHTAHAASA